MKTILVITNTVKDPDNKFTDSLCEKIEKRGHRAIKPIRESADGRQLKMPENEKADYCIVLGGDGTMLKAARDTLGMDIPMLGINLGTLGFLADVEMDKVDAALDRVFAGDYIIQERMMIDGELIRKDETIRLLPALNDITVTRKGPLRIIRFNIYVNGQQLCRLSADGVIIATPTGSTGYNMSAGGPIVQPGTQLMVITPICAHGNNMRPVVIGAGDTVEIEIEPGSDGSGLPVEVYVDGSGRYDMDGGDRIRIGQSEYHTKLMRMNRLSFLETLNRKLGSVNM